MKNKIMLIFILAFFLGGMVQAHEIKIHRPKAGDIYCKDDDYAKYKVISWVVNNDISITYMHQVKVMLYDSTGTNMLQVLFPSTNGLDGVIEWWDITSLASGFYRIKVEILSDQ